MVIFNSCVKLPEGATVCKFAVSIDGKESAQLHLSRWLRSRLYQHWICKVHSWFNQTKGVEFWKQPKEDLASTWPHVYNFGV